MLLKRLKSLDIRKVYARVKMLLKRLKSLDIRKVYFGRLFISYAYFGQLKARCACFSSKIHLSANERKRSSWRIPLIGLRFVSSVTVFS